MSALGSPASVHKPAEQFIPSAPLCPLHPAALPGLLLAWLFLFLLVSDAASSKHPSPRQSSTPLDTHTHTHIIIFLSDSPIKFLHVTIILFIYSCRLNCIPQNSSVEVLTPSTLRCDLIKRGVLYRGNQVKMRSLRWVRIQYDLCPFKKGKFGDRPTQREDCVKMAIHKPGREAWDRPFPSQPSEEPTLLTP